MKGFMIFSCIYVNLWNRKKVMTRVLFVAKLFSQLDSAFDSSKEMYLALLLGGSVVFLNIWMNKYVQLPSEVNPLFVGIFDSFCYTFFMILFRFILMNFSKQGNIAIHPQTLFQKLGFWPLICVLSAFGSKFLSSQAPPG